MQNEIKLGTLKQIDIHEVWKDEARDFTPWLLNNVDELSAALELDLELHQAEYPVGKFSCDLVGVVSGTQDRVVIENQLGQSDHSHFGQIMTYAGGTNAKYVIWIAGKFRDEYLAALKWLNDGTTDDINFFAVEVGAVRIADSIPAPHFTVVARPNDWTKDAKALTTAAITGERGQKQIEYWDDYLAKVAAKYPAWTSSRRGRAQHWFPMAGGLSGCTYSASFTKSQLKSELVFDSADAEMNLARFGFLEEHKDEIEEAYGGTIIWYAPENKKQTMLRIVKDADFANEDSWAEATDWLIDSQARLRKATQPFINQLKARK